MKTINVEWSDLKSFVDSRGVSIQFVEAGKKYFLVAIDSSFALDCTLRKNGDADVVDFETNYKADGNKKLDHSDPDTGAMSMTNQFAPEGFYQRLHEVEFTTSKGDLHDKDMFNIDTGWSSVRYYEDISGTETLMVSPTQTDLDNDCIRTDYSFMPNVDYMVKSGVILHQDLIDVATNGEIYMWGSMLDVDAALNAYGIFPIEVLGGGMAMSFVDSRKPVGLKGVNGSMLYHAGVMAPTGFVPLTAGLGTNRITFIMRHNAGIKHRFQAIFEIFRG